MTGSVLFFPEPVSPVPANVSRLPYRPRFVTVVEEHTRSCPVVSIHTGVRATDPKRAA